MAKYFLVLILAICFGSLIAIDYNVKVVKRPATPILSFLDKTSTFQQIFNPSFIEASAGTGGKQGLIARTQDCISNVGDACVFCGGSQSKASVLTFSEQTANGFTVVDSSSVVFGPGDISDTWGTEDPRVQFNPADGAYYMFYTAYNGSSIMLSLATSSNPTSSQSWTRHGPVFPTLQNTKSAALIIREKPPHYLFWGDHEIRVTKSDDLTKWASVGEVLLETRADSFDSQLVESGPPPLRLTTGDYLFFYNSAQLGWPQDLSTAYHVGRCGLGYFGWQGSHEDSVSLINSIDGT